MGLKKRVDEQIGWYSRFWIKLMIKFGDQRWRHASSKLCNSFISEIRKEFSENTLSEAIIKKSAFGFLKPAF